MDDVREHQLSVTIDGVECKVSPTTDASTVKTENGERLSDILDKYTPISLTYSEYLERIKSGEITASDKRYYRITDDVDGITISDSTVSRSSTFSSRKIVELLASLGLGGVDIPTSSGNMTLHTVTVKPEDWSSSESDNSATASVSIPGISNDTVVLVSLSNKLTSENYSAQSLVVNNAKILRIQHTDSTLILYAFGVVPTIPIQLEISIIN